MLNKKIIDDKKRWAKYCRRRKITEGGTDRIDFVLNKWRESLQKTNTLAYEINLSSQKISKYIQDKKVVSPSLMEEMKTRKSDLERSRIETRELEKLLDSWLVNLPNELDDEVPTGESEDDNELVEKYTFSGTLGKRKNVVPHWTLLEKAEFADFGRSSKIAGSRFIVYKNKVAKLLRVLVDFMIDHHQENDYQEIIAPVIINKSSLFGSGQLPKFEEDVFRLKTKDYYLSPTSEVQLLNMHRNEILNSYELPLKYCSYSPCFRSESGAAGRDTRGIIRMHQFNKVETFVFCEPEDSKKEHIKMLENNLGLLRKLDLPHRVVKLCEGDTGFCAQLTYDIEVWLPSYDNYKEISSCSRCGDFQARRSLIRTRDENKKTKFLHTLNGTGLAIDRTIAAIVENYQTSDTDFQIPEVLKKYW